MAPHQTSFVIEIKIAATERGEHDRLLEKLVELADSDPAFGFSISAEGEITLGGGTEQQLDAVITALKLTNGSNLEVGAPQIAYRETLFKRVEIDETHKKQSGGSGQFARVKMLFEPAEPGAGVCFKSKVVGGSVSEEFVPGVEKGFNSVLGSGSLAGFPVVDVKGTLVDGAYHDVDSSVLDFEICARAAFRRALKEAGVVLEPIMKVKVTTPEEYTGSVIGDLDSRRGQVQGQDMRDNAVVIDAMVPLANMFGYVNQLRSFTRNRASFTMSFSHYAPLPPRDDGPFSPAVGMRA